MRSTPRRRLHTGDGRGHELIRHWNQEPTYTKAVITAALDHRRVGDPALLTRDYFADASPAT
ncbi:hypothetical protein [Amycolatopsis sp. NPDC051128]|uniref:hypothetical protein n=1 Tax=Amycolatopsis sp. NPDC051128 TaxID=3155412 RepID=UPI00342FC5CD